MERPSRLRIDPVTHLPGISSFGQISQFLRGAVADEDSRILSESMAQLVAGIEAIHSALRIDRSRARMAPLLMDLLELLRAHRHLVVQLGAPWRSLYEYPGYLNALNNFRVLLGQWLLDGGPDASELTFGPDEFQLVAWRTLGEGVLLIDMYEQRATQAQQPPSSALGALHEPGVRRAMSWWQRLRSQLRPG